MGQMRTFTRSELARFDGRDGRRAYVAYRGKVYDVTGLPNWSEGTHFDEHPAGRDLTDALGLAPHADEVFEDVPIIGMLVPADR